MRVAPLILLFVGSLAGGALGAYLFAPDAPRPPSHTEEVATETVPMQTHVALARRVSMLELALSSAGGAPVPTTPTGASPVSAFDGMREDLLAECRQVAVEEVNRRFEPEARTPEQVTEYLQTINGHIERGAFDDGARQYFTQMGLDENNTTRVMSTSRDFLLKRVQVLTRLNEQYRSAPERFDRNAALDELRQNKNELLGQLKQMVGDERAEQMLGMIQGVVETPEYLAEPEAQVTPPGVP